MNFNKQVKLTGSGSFLPGSPIPFSDIDDYLGEITQAPKKVMKWLKRIKLVMKEMLDIEYYHYAIDPITREFTEDNVSMSVKASKKAIESAGLTPEDIDVIIYASAHMDQMPTASSRIQEQLGIESCAELSIHSNCTSVYKAIMLAHDLLRIGRYNNALVVSSSISSSELRAEYYNQPIVKKEELFLRNFLCDGAGALVLEATDSPENDLILKHTYIESIGGKKPSVMFNKRPAYYLNPKIEFEKGYHHLTQVFQEQLRLHFHDDDGTVFYKGLKRMIDKYDIDLAGLKFFQINLPSKHVSELVLDECEELGISRDTLYTKMSNMGYSGPPMVLICLDKIFREEKFQKNDMILSFVTEVSKFMQGGFTFIYE